MRGVRAMGWIQAILLCLAALANAPAAGAPPPTATAHLRVQQLENRLELQIDQQRERAAARDNSPGEQFLLHESLLNERLQLDALHQRQQFRQQQRLRINPESGSTRANELRRFRQESEAQRLKNKLVPRIPRRATPAARPAARPRGRLF